MSLQPSWEASSAFGGWTPGSDTKGGPAPGFGRTLRRSEIGRSLFKGNLVVKPSPLNKGPYFQGGVLYVEGEVG